ncbi:hypothetical protein NE865_03582 [Phthorimaea operculella]|nr:hypothetical protein NE865_03582 [Phthorimaea operculella]
MNIPPFPAHDLAKLVLGYLAEEQLMTAYDEFLSASPYLDAMRNEYDRIFMTSLKNILAEYRAVKIYVETCKPYALRRRLFGCTNLLEIVKFLVQHVDVNKLQVPDGAKTSVEGRNSCAVCLSLKLPSCECKSRHSLSSISQSNTQRSGLETSVEATPLEDLPGNHVTNKKRQVKTLCKDSRVSQSVLSSDSHSEINVENNCTPTFAHTLPNNSQPLQARLQISNTANNTGDPVNPNVGRVEKHVSHTSAHHRANINCPENVATQRVSLAGTFQDFTSGVPSTAGAENINTNNIPDSSTSEYVSLQPPSSKEICLPGPTNNKPVSKAHIFLTVGTIKTTTTPQVSLPQSPASPALMHSRVKPTTEKVTILSDIKVDKNFSNEPAMPPILKNATSTPLMHMQTILINGTPVYKPQPPAMGRNFTKDEIMAMPTIIVVPTSGPSQVPADVPCVPSQIPPQHTNPSTSTISSTAPSLEPLTSTAPILEPLTIDVAPNNPPVSQDTTVSNNSMPLLDQHTNTVQKNNEKEMLVKTLDAKMVSAPRDGGDPTTKNTPQVLPPVRKSSSTPRRTSHVRVLDFATPRRILQEAITENVAGEEATVEVVISRSPNLHTLADPAISNHSITNEDDKTHKAADSTANSSGSSKENDRIPTKKNNWDADLRAHAITNRKEDIPKSCIAPRCRPRTKPNKSKLSDKKSTDKGTDDKVNKSKKVHSKRKSTEAAKESAEVPKESVIVVDDSSNVPVKPTINIITGQDWSGKDNDKNKSNKSDSTDPTDTPEMDRILSNNGIGIKLNISELLETPYKQVLYDIQMETPRFLGPDLPGDPMSDIKISNIPTPRFLNTPKVQATPSSYSSRPTDYSSGGSYYKPDDQDYVPVGLDYPVTESMDSETDNIANNKNIDEHVTEKDVKSSSRAKSGRPVRKCAKNVSYYNSVITKTKDTDDEINKNTSTVENDNSGETKIEMATGSKHPKERKNEKESTPKSVKQSKRRRESVPKILKEKEVVEESDANTLKDGVDENEIETEPVSKPVKGNKAKRSSNSKKHKSPMKKESTKSFMKIKPRRLTPTKENVKGKTKSKTPEGKPRKRTSSKEKVSDPESVVKCAPTKSRRKSATPRKFTAKSGIDSPEMTARPKSNLDQDSDTERVPLHWSDEGTQDDKLNEPPKDVSSNETEDISKIKDYIASELRNANVTDSGSSLNTLHVDLIKRGFDAETAKIIERDLLDSSVERKEINPINKKESNVTASNKDIPANPTEASHTDLVSKEKAPAGPKEIGSASPNEVDSLDSKETNPSGPNKIISADPKETNPTDSNQSNPARIPPVTSVSEDVQAEKTLESDASNNLQIQEEEEEDEEEELKFSEYECHEESSNFITCNHDDIKDIPRGPVVKLKDKYSIEVNVDDDLTIRLRATPFTTVLDHDPIDYNEKETELAVSSISNIDKLYTPMKDPDIRAQVYNIFDSTLTSLDTPMKATSPRRNECDTTVSQVSVQVEKLDDKEKPEEQRRKRLHSDESNDSVSSNKRSKPETQYFTLNSANIQNIDIETVLSKLHGP